MKMKGYQFTLALTLLFIFIGSGNAEQSATPMPSPENTKKEAITFEKCKFVTKNTMKSQLVNEGYAGYVWIRLWPRSMDLHIPLSCHPRSDKKSLEMELGAKQINGKWQPAGGAEKGCDPAKSSKTVICEFINNVPFLPEQQLRVISLDGSNWRGIGILIDDTTGEERTRQRELRYCIYHDEVALCGQVFVRNLMKPHKDVLSTVLKVLNSIEFVDDVSPNSSETPLR